jgi:putative ABC transport system permease protein
MFQVHSGASQRTALVFRVDPERQHDQSLFNEVQEQVWSLDRDLPIYNATTLEALISESVAQRRFTTLLILSFALIGLVLALIGLFGVMAYLVAQRQREVAIRMALGADPTGVRRLVMKRGAALAMAGCAIGLVLFPLGGRFIQAMLFQTSAYDPAALLLVAALLLGVALLASYIPARRASRVDPMVALRFQ